MRHYIFMQDGPRAGKHLLVTDPKHIAGLAVGYTFRYLDQSYRITALRNPGVWSAALASERQFSAAEEEEKGNGNS